MGLGKSLKLVNDLGIANAEKQIRRLTDLLHERLAGTKAHVVSKRDPEVRSGITIFQYYRDPKQDQALLERILRERVYVAMRFTSNVGGIRVSTHYFNNEEDVERLIAALKKSVA